MDRESKTHEHEQRFTRMNEHVDHIYLYMKNSHQSVKTRYIYPGREQRTRKDRTIDEIDADPA